MASLDHRVRAAVQRHLQVVWRVLRRSGVPDADADDATQDVFWVFSQRAIDVPEAKERAFLLAVALRVASDRRRSKWGQRSAASIDVEALASEVPAADEALAQYQRRALLDQAVACLGDAEREVFVLMELEQMTREEVAEILRIPAGTVASRLRRARIEFHEAAQDLRGDDGRFG